MSNKVGLTLKAKFDNGRSVSGGGAVFHTERARKEDRLNLKTEPNTITLYRHGLEQIDKTDSRAVFGYFKDLEESIKTDYQQHSHRHRKWQDKNELFYEGIIAFGREQFEQLNNPQQVMDYCVSFCDTLEARTGAKIHMVSLHLDEGHLDGEGTLQHNYHAHFLLVNYNQAIHKSALRNARIQVDEYKTEVKTYTNKAGETRQKTVKTTESTGNKIEALYDFKQIQNDLGQHFAGLGFERGRDYAAEGLKCPKNIDHKQYREIMEQKQEIVREIYTEHYQPLENNLEKLKKALQPLVDTAFKTAEEQNQPPPKTYNDLAAVINERLKTLEANYKQARQELKDSRQAQQTDYQNLKKAFEQEQAEVKRLAKKIKSIAVAISHANNGEKSLAELQLLEFATSARKNPTPDSIRTNLVQIIQRNKEQKTAINELETQKSADVARMKQLESDYRQTSQDLSETKKAHQETKQALSESRETRNQLLAENHSLKTQLTAAKTELIQKTEELSEAKIKNTALKQAIERFLSLDLWADIQDATKNAVSRLNSFFDRFKNKELHIAPISLEKKQEEILNWLDAKKEYFKGFCVINWEKGALQWTYQETEAVEIQKAQGQEADLIKPQYIDVYLDRYKEKFNQIRVSKTEFEAFKTENKELLVGGRELLARFESMQKENQQLREQLNEQNPTITTNEDVLRFYERIVPKLVAQVRKDKGIDVPGPGGGQWNLKDEDPQYLAQLFAKVTGQKIPQFIKQQEQTKEKDRNRGFDMSM